MCCFLTIFALFGPRFANIIWWIAQPARWDKAFDMVVWPILGILFVPWTTLMYVGVSPGGVNGFDWFWVALAVFADIASYSGSAWGNRDRVDGGPASQAA